MRRLTRHFFANLLFASFLVAGFLLVRSHQAQAAACSLPTTDYGKVTQSVSITSTGTYRIWSRVKVTSTNKDYILKIGTQCYTVGGSTLTPGSWVWVNSETSGSIINHNFATTGAQSIELIGTGDGLEIDRVIFTQSTTCIPDNTVDGNGKVGENCANPPDTTKPVVNFAGNTPADGATIKDTVNIQATATDDSGTVSKVELFIDGTSKGTLTASAGTYSYSWVTTSGYPDGSHTIRISASDAAVPANTQDVTRTFNVVNGKPDFQIIAVTATSTANRTPASIKAGDSVRLTATVKNFGTVAAAPRMINFGFGATSVGTVDVTTVLNPGASQQVTLSQLWTAVSGSQTVTATADNTNAVVESSETNNSLPYSFTVDINDTTPPTVSITSPTAGTELKDTVTLSATASDLGGSGVSSVVFYDGTTLLGTGTKSGASYSLSWDTKSATNSSHVLKAVATDGQNNVTNSATVAVTVNNQVAVRIPGDIDNNGAVNTRDFSKFALNYGKNAGTATWEQGDFNGDKNVTGADFSLLAKNFKVGP